MHLEDLLTLLQVRQLDVYLSVKTTGTQQRGIQHIRTVSSSQNDHTAVRTKTVHLCQQLVQGALALIVSTRHRVLTTRTTDRIDLIDEDDSRCFLLSLTEQVTYTTRTYTHEHLHEIRTAHREERHVRFTCYGFCQQGLTCSRRAY